MDRPLLLILGQALIGFYFVFYGVWNIYHWVPIIKTMNEDKIPAPYLLLPIGITWQITAGVMIMLNSYTRLAAFTLIPFTIIAVFMFHSFWKFRGEMFIQNLTVFVANLTVVPGALLLLIGPFKSFMDLLG